VTSRSRSLEKLYPAFTAGLGQTCTLTFALQCSGLVVETTYAATPGVHIWRKVMRKPIGVLAAGLVLAAFVSFAWADEEKVPLDKVPAKVLEAVKAKFPDAELTGASKEKENNEIIYEVSIKHDGHKIDVELKEDGTILAVEKTIDTKDLPEKVTDAIKEKYGKVTYKKAEEVSKKDKLEYYEVVIETADKKVFEAEVSPEGKVLKEEEKKKKEKD
jgi:hypothetical protein